MHDTDLSTLGTVLSDGRYNAVWPFTEGAEHWSPTLSVNASVHLQFFSCERRLGHLLAAFRQHLLGLKIVMCWVQKYTRTFSVALSWNPYWLHVFSSTESNLSLLSVYLEHRYLWKIQGICRFVLLLLQEGSLMMSYIMYGSLDSSKPSLLLCFGIMKGCCVAS